MLWLERHDLAVRRELARFRGVELDTAGDGVFASFDGPSGLEFEDRGTHRLKDVPGEWQLFAVSR